MKALIIDTETNGLPVYRDKATGLPIPADDPRQPRMAHLAMIYVDGDKTREKDLYIKPDGWTMPQGPNSAGEVNGLTDEFLNANGVPVIEALELYSAAVREGYVVVAYNAQFDLKILRGELRRAGMDDLFMQTSNICVMRPLTNICRILKNNPRTDDDFKFPKLSEALEFFGFTNDAPHTGPADARGALAIFRELQKRDALPVAEVHFAANHGAAAAPKPSRKRAVKSGPAQANDQIPE